LSASFARPFLERVEDIFFVSFFSAIFAIIKWLLEWFYCQNKFSLQIRNKRRFVVLYFNDACSAKSKI